MKHVMEEFLGRICMLCVLLCFDGRDCVCCCCCCCGGGVGGWCPYAQVWWSAWWSSHPGAADLRSEAFPIRGHELRLACLWTSFLFIFISSWDQEWTCIITWTAEARPIKLSGTWPSGRFSWTWSSRPSNLVGLDAFFFCVFLLKPLFAFRAIGKHHQVSAAHQEGLQAGGWHEDPAVSHQNFH